MADTKGAKPEDHKQSIEAEHDARIAREELLKDMPALKPAERLRIRQRNRVNEIMVDAVASGAVGDDDADGIDLDFSNPDDVKRFKALQELAAQVDEFAESIADDPAAYATWAEGKEADTFLAILSVYNEAVGESNGS